MLKITCLGTAGRGTSEAQLLLTSKMNPNNDASLDPLERNIALAFA